MKTLLLSTNFSGTSVHVIRYAAALAEYIGAQKLVLYNTYAAPLTTSDLSFSFIETEGLQKLSEEELQKGRKLAASLLPESIAVETRSDYGFAEQQIDAVAGNLQADLVITGIENRSTLEEALEGSTAMHLVQHTQTPVLMVPPDAAWHPIRQIAWACDYRNQEKTSPVCNVQSLLQATGAVLHVIHNDPAHQQSDEDLQHYQHQIRSWFPGIAIRFARLEEKELKEAVNRYVTEHAIDLLIAVPKKHSWLENLFSTSHSKQLAAHSHIPVICVRSAT